MCSSTAPAANTEVPTRLGASTLLGTQFSAIAANARHVRFPNHTVHYDGSPILPRVMTILYYLNGVGATWFPFADATGDDADLIEKSGRDQILDRTAALDPSSAGVLVEPSGPGDAVAFFNFDADGVRDPYSLHAGTTVGEGDDKWLAAHFFQAPSLVASSEAMRALAWRREQEALNAAQGISDELEAAK